MYSEDIEVSTRKHPTAIFALKNIAPIFAATFKIESNGNK